MLSRLMLYFQKNIRRRLFKIQKTTFRAQKTVVMKKLEL